MSAESERQRQYREVYLRSDHWQRMRRLALEDAENHCAVCNSAKQLDVHHRTYERLGEERLTDLLVLCRDCHQVFHEHRRLAGARPPAKQRKAAKKRAQGLAIRESRRKAKIVAKAKAQATQQISPPLRGAFHIEPLRGAAPPAPRPQALQHESLVPRHI